MTTHDRNPREVLEWLTRGDLDDLVTEEEVFEELYAEGIDLDAIIAGAHAAFRRIRLKLRVLGVPVEDICELAPEGG